MFCNIMMLLCCIFGYLNTRIILTIHQQIIEIVVMLLLSWIITCFYKAIIDIRKCLKIIVERKI